MARGWRGGAVFQLAELLLQKPGVMANTRNPGKGDGEAVERI